MHCPCCCDAKTGISGIGIIALITSVLIAYRTHSLMNAVTDVVIGLIVLASVTIALTVVLIVRKARDNVVIPRYTPILTASPERVIIRETVTVREIAASPAPVRAYVSGEVEPVREPAVSPYPAARVSPAEWEGGR
jgi:hypothetical protein